MKFLYPLIFSQLKKISPYFLFCIVALQALGLFSLYSAAYGSDGANLFLFQRQLIWIAFSWMVFFLLAYSKASFISKIIRPFFWIHIIALALVFFIGKEAHNATRWLDLGLFHFQPSETLKLALALLTAQQLAQRRFGQALQFKDLLLFCAVAIPPVVLVFLQPDLGTAGILLLMIFTMLLCNGIEKKTLAGLILIALISGPLAWNKILKPYQKSRITSFIQPGEDPQGTGYNVIQSKIAIGSGQFFGKGFKKGTQNKLQFLPERHTDFIFSVLSEEYGFIGSSLTLALFFLMISFIFNLAGQLRDRLSCYCCIGAGAFFLWHTALNLAMTMGFFPVVGIPLPLFSYGGSHILTSMAFLGVTASIYRNKDLF